MVSVARSKQARTPLIVIPVYNAFEAFERAIEALFKHAADCSIIIVDDASTDQRIGSLLEKIKQRDEFRLLRNKENLGYTRSVNKGIRAAGTTDIVLLNSDTQVTPGWLEGLLLPGLLDDKVGTVTAMSDNAGAFSFPEPGESNPLPEGVDRDEFARRLVTATGGSPPVAVPTGSGFCMWIRGELISEIGLFDETAFPRGYGEENDFCMRAMAAGWHNVISPWSYVYHERGASFGEEKKSLLDRGLAELKRRHPDYMPRVKEAFSSREINLLRKAARLCFP